ncbi:unnamed protein product [Clavelina lepadiformis]|uniref:Uncharacterized protein n=1 Tax=Clavelina lepadiformis TaxID=159417 RepID=A0ABP0FUY8_CLALP
MKAIFLQPQTSLYPSDTWSRFRSHTIGYMYTRIYTGQFGWGDEVVDLKRQGFGGVRMQLRQDECDFLHQNKWCQKRK